MSPVILPAARDDMLRQFRYYLVDQDNAHVAERFLTAVRKTVNLITRTPHGGTPKRLSLDALRGLRSWPVKRFEDVRVYYLTAEVQVQVFRVLHGRRDINGILNDEANGSSQ